VLKLPVLLPPAPLPAAAACAHPHATALSALPHLVLAGATTPVGVAPAQAGYYLLHPPVGRQMLGGRESPATVAADVLVAGEVVLRDLECSVRQVTTRGKPCYRLDDLCWQLPDQDWLLVSAEAPGDGGCNWQLHMWPPQQLHGSGVQPKPESGAAAAGVLDQEAGGRACGVPLQLMLEFFGCVWESGGSTAA
jgi:hypothetical protein